MPGEYPPPSEELANRLESLSRPDAKDRRMVRTTFRLPDAALVARDWLAQYHRITAAEAVDHALQLAPIFDKPELVTKYSEEAGERRSMALQRATLTALEEHSERIGVHRDQLLDCLLRLTAGFERSQVEKRAEAYRKASDLLDEIVGVALQTCYERLVDLLGDDDPVVQRLQYIETILDILHSAIDTQLSGGPPVDPDDFSQSA